MRFVDETQQEKKRLVCNVHVHQSTTLVNLNVQNNTFIFMFVANVLPDNDSKLVCWAAYLNGAILHVFINFKLSNNDFNSNSKTFSF